MATEPLLRTPLPVRSPVAAGRSPEAHGGPADGAPHGPVRRPVGVDLRVLRDDLGPRLCGDVQDSGRTTPPGQGVRIERRVSTHWSVPPREIQTVAGFTAWRCLGVLSVVGAVWGLLAGTRLLRGEEDAGRWELLLAGQTTRRRAAGQALIGLGLGVAALWAVTAVVTILIGRSSKVGIATGSALYFSLALVVSAAIFLAVGAFTSQLASTRRRAAAYAGAALGVSYALRMVADSGAGLAWLRWTTPLGWAEELRPLTAPRAWALLPIFAVVLVLVALTVSWPVAAISAPGSSPITTRLLRILDFSPDRRVWRSGSSVRWPSVGGRRSRQAR